MVSVRLFTLISDMLRNFALLMMGGLMCMATLEVGLRVLPTSTYTDTGYHIDPLIITYRPHHQFRSSWGWNFRDPLDHEANNLGFLSSRDFLPDSAAVAVVGDSFVDASMLPEAERVAARLQSALGGRPVYAMGGPGSSLLDYAERLRYAADKLAVRDFVVIMERGDIKQSYCGSGNIHGPCLIRGSGQSSSDLRSAPSTAQLYLRHSALLQYLLGHLRFDPVQRLRSALAALSQPAASTTAAPREYSSAELALVLDKFFERIAPYRRGRLVLVFDSDRNALNRGEPSSDETRLIAMAQARVRGALVVDTEASFREYLARSGRRLEVSPLDQHWNPQATAIVARDIAAALTSSATR